MVAIWIISEISKKSQDYFVSFSVAISPIVIIFDVLKSSWIELLDVLIFVGASAIVADCCAVTTDGLPVEIGYWNHIVQIIDYFLDGMATHFFVFSRP